MRNQLADRGSQQEEERRPTSPLVPHGKRSLARDFTPESCHGAIVSFESHLVEQVLDDRDSAAGGRGVPRQRAIAGCRAARRPHRCRCRALYRSGGAISSGSGCQWRRRAAHPNGLQLLPTDVRWAATGDHELAEGRDRVGLRDDVRRPVLGEVATVGVVDVSVRRVTDACEIRRVD